MSQEGLNIAQLLSALSRKGIPLPFEMGTFIVLETTEQVLTLEATETTPSFCRVVPEEIWLSDQGEVGLEATMTASEPDACRALVMLLGDLLVRSAPGVPAMLLDIVEHGPSDGQWTLMRLRDDLEAALVPLNRSATRRVLARLLREVRRDVERGGSVPAPNADALANELDDLLGADARPALSLKPKNARSERKDATVEVDLDELSPHEPETATRAPARYQAREPQPDARKARKPRAAVRANVAQLNERAEPAPRLDRAELDSFEEPEARGSGFGLRVGLGLGLLAAALGAGYLLLGQTASRSALGLSPTPEAVAPLPAEPPKPKQQPRVGELRITSTPGRAQVLMFVGKAPVIVPKLPTGVAYEFVALADGFAPSRAVVPANAEWPREGDEPRYELAMQLNESKAKRAEDDLGATRLGQDVGNPSATLGSVRVITSPPGAKVYQLIGFTPDVRVENMPIGEPIELVVFLSGYGPRRLTVNEGDWKPQPGGLVAELDVKLERRK